MFVLISCFLIVISSIHGQSLNQSIVLHIGAFFNTDFYDLQAAQLAIEEINLRSNELFHNRYRLTLLSNHSRCDPIYAVDAFFHAIFRRPQLLFLLGTSCSNETKAVIQVADYYNLILFSHSTSFISLTNETSSTLVRLSVSDENYNSARVAWIKSNNWSHVAIVHQDSIEHVLMIAKLAKCLNESNINVILTQSASMSNLTAALKNLRVKKARIVFVNFDTSTRALFFCEVYRTFDRALRERYVWILTGNDYHLWNFSSNNCTKKQIMEAARGHIIIDSSFEIRSNSINPNTTAEQLQKQLGLNEHLNRQILHAYDAIWVIAFLIRASIEHHIPIERFSYGATNMKDQWLNLLEQIHFLGVSGPVSFRNRQRQAETLISQIRFHGKQQRIQTLGEYSHISGLNTNCSTCGKSIWPGVTPVDTERSEIRRLVMNHIEIALITITCLLGLALAIFFLTFNVMHRHQRYIKLSSPNLNNVMVIGAMHIHISILLFAFDEWFLDRNLLGHACLVRIFLFSGGFSLMFGSMFLKTLRVYRIFTSRNRPLLHSKLLQDYHLLLICFYLYGIDLLIALVWQIFDPHHAKFTHGSVRPYNADMTVVDELYYCDSIYRHKILPLIYFYKSWFLVSGGYLAAKTRHVHIAALNDSRFIVWSIYIVVLGSLFTFIVMISLANLRIYLAMCLVVIMMTSSILCLVFLPKVIRLKKRRKTMQDVISKDLVMDQSRTRRLVVEIGYYEKYRYAQLQNRELKAELVRLNHILHSLEQKLDPTSTNVSKAFFPLAVRWASTFIHKSDVHSPNLRSHSKPTVDKMETIDFLENPSMSSNNAFSTSSEFNLSVLLQSIQEVSSSSLNTSDHHEDKPMNNDIEEKQSNTSLSLTFSQQSSDNESVLYLRLPDELNIDVVGMESDFERFDR